MCTITVPSRSKKSPPGSWVCWWREPNSSAKVESIKVQQEHELFPSARAISTSASPLCAEGRDFPKENRKNFALNRQPGRDDSTEQTCTFSRRPAPARPKKTASTLVRSVADSKMTAFPTGLAATSPCKMTRLFPSIPCMTSSKLLVECPRRRRADFGRSILLVATPPDR